MYSSGDAMNQVAKAHSANEDRDPERAAGQLAIEVVEEIVRLMEQRGMTRDSLAAAMGVSPSFVSRMLNATPAMTLQTVARCAAALGARAKLTFGSEAPAGPSAEARRRLDLGIGETSEPREVEH